MTIESNAGPYHWIQMMSHIYRNEQLFYTQIGVDDGATCKYSLAISDRPCIDNNSLILHAWVKFKMVSISYSYVHTLLKQEYTCLIIPVKFYILQCSIQLWQLKISMLGCIAFQGSYIIHPCFNDVYMWMMICDMVHSNIIPLHEIFHSQWHIYMAGLIAQVASVMMIA